MPTIDSPSKFQLYHLVTLSHQQHVVPRQLRLPSQRRTRSNIPKPHRVAKTESRHTVHSRSVTRTPSYISQCTSVKEQGESPPISTAHLRALGNPIQCLKAAGHSPHTNGIVTFHPQYTSNTRPITENLVSDKQTTLNSWIPFCPVFVVTLPYYFAILPYFLNRIKQR